MRRFKYAVWILGAIALFILACIQGIGNGSSYIQFVDGAVLVYGAGELIEKKPHIKRFIETHHVLHQRVEHLHEKFDNHIGKDDES